MRRAKIIEEVIDLIADVGADAVQMRDVAQRSGVALATMYRYFSSKENLLAAALEDWQKRLTRRVLGSGGRPDGDPLPAVLDYLRRAQRAFYRNPEMTALMLQMMASTDPEVKDIIDQMDRNNVEMFDRLLDGVAPEVDFEHQLRPQHRTERRPGGAAGRPADVGGVTRSCRVGGARLTGSGNRIPRHFQHIAHRGACGKTPSLPQNRWPD